MIGEGFSRKTRNGLSPASIVADRLGRTARPPKFAGVRVQAPDKSAAWGIAVQIANGEYDYAGYRPEQGEHVVDIGANVGLFALWAARRGASVVAYEPAPSTFDCLVQNTEGRDVKPVHAAIVGEAPATGTIDLYLHDDQSVCNTIVGRDVQTGADLATVERVPALALADVLDGPCDLLKVDCEGAEYEIFDAVPDDVLRRARRIVVEFHRVAGTPEHLRARFERAGFTTEMLDPGTGEPYGVIGAVRTP